MAFLAGELRDHSLRLLLCTVVSFWLVDHADAETIRISLAMLPVGAETTNRGAWVELIRAMQEIDSENHFEWDVLPFERAIRNVIFGKADVEIPFVIDGRGDTKYPFRVTSIPHLQTNFVLYRNRNKEIDPAHLERYHLETDVAHCPLFDFPIVPSHSIESSLRKVDARRIDGFIFADNVTDPVLKAVGLQNIRRSLFHTYDVGMVLPLNGGGEAATIILRDIDKLKQTGRYDQIMAPFTQSYVGWQVDE